MDKESDILIKAFEENKSVLKSIFELSFQKFTKPKETSDQCRKVANELFQSKKHDYVAHYRVFYNYCKSIATAPNDSENMALAYGNKTAFLLHIEKYEECIKDIDRTLSFAKSKTLKIKLLCRKVECMKKLSLDWQRTIDDAKHYLNKIDEDEKKAFAKLIKRTEALPVSENGVEVQEDSVGKLPEETTDMGGFSIQCSEADGTHLVAAKDYEPGDAIFVESLLVTTVNSQMNHIICQYCLKTCWSSVPCDKCSWAMFCSDDCKESAWQEFHEVECSLIPYLKVVNDLWQTYHLSIRTLIVGMRTAGSIDQLKEELKSVNEKTNISFKGYFNDGKFESTSIQNVFLLNCDKVPDDKLESMSLLALVTLIGLVKHTPLLENVTLEDIDDLIKDENLIFLGSVLLKLIVIKSVTYSSITNTSYRRSCEQEKKTKPIVSGFRHSGSCFAPLTNLLKYSCVPNVARCFAEDRKVIVYALCPIEEGSQLFMNPYVKFDKVPLKERKEVLEKLSIICDCQACSENWPPILHLSKKYLKKYNYAISTDVEKEVYEDCKDILEAVQNDSGVAFTAKDIEKLSEAVKLAATEKYPSYLTSLLIEAMHQIYLNLYGLKLQTMKDCKEKEEKRESSKGSVRKSL